MRFRIAGRCDVGPCLALIREDRGFRATPALDGRWGALVESLVGNGAATLIVLEDPTARRFDLTGCLLTAFVAPSLIAEYERQPEPYFANLVYRRTLSRQPAALPPDAVGAANGGGGLHLAVLHFTLRHRSLSHPVARRCLRAASAAWHFVHSGFRLETAWFEAYGSELGEYLQLGGFELWRAFDDHPESRAPTGHSPRMYRITRGEPRGRAPGLASHALFNAPEPRFGFAPAEQRVLVHALLGETDREIADSLDLSIQTVHKAWLSVFRRVEMTCPALVVQRDSEGRRGPERRRHLLEYLRYHMEELRPHRSGPPVRSGQANGASSWDG